MTSTRSSCGMNFPRIDKSVVFPAGGRLQLGMSRGSPEQVIDGWRYFGYRPIEGESDAGLGRRHAEEFLELLRGKGFARPNPRPMFPNPPGFCALSRTPKACVIASGGDQLPMRRPYGLQSWE